MDIVVRSVFMYFLILFMLRLTTRRIIRSATPIDMGVIFLFGGLAVQPILGQDHSVTGATLAVCTIAGLHLLISRLRLIWPVIGMVTNGTPVIIYSRGEWDFAEMRQLRIQKEDVLAEARQNGLRSLEEVDSVVVEHNGGISVISKN